MPAIQRKDYNVSAPYLFKGLLSFAPKTLTARDLQSFHRNAYATVSATLMSQGAPGLKPVNAFALHKAEYHKKVEALTSSLGYSFSSVGGLCQRKDTGSGVEFDIHYNLDLLAANTHLTGPVVVHEVMSTCLGSYTERLLEHLKGSPQQTEETDAALSHIAVLSEGFAALFSQSPHPFSARFLLETEHALAHPQEYIEDTDRQLALKAITDVHCFPAIALLKIEAAFGFAALMELLNGLGPFDKTPAFGSHNLRDRLMSLYYSANESMGDDSIDFKRLV